MRRVIGFVLVGLGVFGIVLGLLLRFYAYPRLAMVPLNQQSESVSVGQDMTVFYVSRLEEESGVEVTATRLVRGDPDAAEAKPDGNVMVWDVGVVIEDTEGTVISASLDHLCLDRHTNEAVQPCEGEGIEDNSDDNTIDADDQVRHEGLSYKFPFGTEQRDYRYFDNSTKRAETIRYLGEETIEGVPTYKFEQIVPLTKLDDRQVPGRLVGQPDEQTVTAGRYYENTRTVWVEPYSGIIVKGTESVEQTLRDANGRPHITLFGGTIGFTDQTISESAADARDARSRLQLVRTVGPAVLISVGAVLLLIGLALALFGRGGGSAAPGRPTGSRHRELQPQ
jgi:hypothetical protein